MQFQALPAMKEYAATPLSKPREGAARPAATNKNGPPQGPIKGDLYTFRGPQAPEQGKHVPEVGLELHSSPPQTLDSRKHAESGPIRPTYDPIRSPKCVLCTHPNFIASSALSLHTVSRHAGIRALFVLTKFVSLEIGMITMITGICRGRDR